MTLGHNAHHTHMLTLFINKLKFNPAQKNENLK